MDTAADVRARRHPYVVLKVRMWLAGPPLPHTSSWSAEQITQVSAFTCVVCTSAVSVKCKVVWRYSIYMFLMCNIMLDATCQLRVAHYETLQFGTTWMNRTFKNKYAEVDRTKHHYFLFVVTKVSLWAVADTVPYLRSWRRYKGSNSRFNRENRPVLQYWQLSGTSHDSRGGAGRSQASAAQNREKRQSCLADEETRIRTCRLRNTFSSLLCGSQNKQLLFPYTALNDWFV